MTPDDLCENVRNIVFEILKRRYPETMPTKWFHNGRPSINIRDLHAAYFYAAPDGGISCNANAVLVLSKDQTDRPVHNGLSVFYWHQISYIIHFITQGLVGEMYNPIADEFGLGVER